MPASRPILYDVTMNLKDEYTSLVSRRLGEEQQATLEKELRNIEETGVLVLDFSVVTSIDKSFFDEFLVPVLHSLGAGKYSDRNIIGVNLDPEKLDLVGLGELLKSHDVLFLTFTRAGEAILLGSPAAEYSRALQYVQTTEKETPAQLSVQLGIDETTAGGLLQRLADGRVVRRRRTESGIEYFDPILSSAEYSHHVLSSIEDEIKLRIDQLRAVDSPSHYQLPSGFHATEFLHFSRVLEDARFANKIATFLGESFKDSAVETIVTTKSPNNMVLAQFLGDYLDAKVITTVQDRTSIELVPTSGSRIDPHQPVLILVDVVATGWIVNLLIDLVSKAGASLEGVAAVVDVSGGRANFNSKHTVKLATLNLKIYPQPECPLCKQGIPVIPARVLPRL